MAFDPFAESDSAASRVGPYRQLRTSVACASLDHVVPAIRHHLRPITNLY